MGRILNIPPGAIEAARDGFSDTLDLWGKSCRLYYPPVQKACNCQGPLLATGNPSNIYQDGSPEFAGLNGCLVCGGTGYTEEVVTEDIVMKIEWDLSTFKDVEIPIELRIPGGFIQTRGYLVDVPKVKRAFYMMAHTSIEAFAQYKYKLFSEPVDSQSIVQGTFFYCYWQRIL